MRMMNRSMPEIFTIAEELLNLMTPQFYDNDIMVYLNNLCPAKKDFSNTKMRKPHV